MCSRTIKSLSFHFISFPLEAASCPADFVLNTCAQRPPLDALTCRPDPDIFNQSYELGRYWVGEDLKRSEILHIGDSTEADLCGAKAAGFQALVLDRTSDPRVSKYQDWLVGPDYAGKSEEDIKQCTINALHDAASLLDEAFVARPS